MAIIVISREDVTLGKEVAEKAAEKLGYRCISRETLLEGSAEFNIPEVRLNRSIEQIPTFFDRFSQKSRRYVAYIRSSLLHNLQQEDVIYHGFAGNFFVKDNPHVVKVRIKSEMGERVGHVMERDGVSEKQALAILKKIDGLRKKWSLKLYGMDPEDPRHYDLVLLLNTLTVGDAADLVCRVSRLPQYASTPESKRAMDDLVLAADARALLLDMKSDVDVWACDGYLYVKKGRSGAQDQDLAKNWANWLQNFLKPRGLNW